MRVLRQYQWKINTGSAMQLLLLDENSFISVYKDALKIVKKDEQSLSKWASF